MNRVDFSRRIMRSIIFVFILIPLVSFSTIKTLDTALKKYVEMLEEYKGTKPPNTLISELKHELNLLPVCRLIKLAVVGSVEKKERATDITDLLTVFYYKRKPKKIEDRLALSLLLAYIASDISNSRLDESLINRLPAFISAYNDYSISVIKEAKAFLSHAIAYSIGLIDSPPDGFTMKKIGNLSSSDNFNYLIYKKGAYHKDIIDMVMNSNIKYRIIEKARDILEKQEKDEKRLKLLITRATASLSREIRNILSKRQEGFVKTAVNKSPRRYDTWRLRFVFYILTVFLILKFRKYWKYFLHAVLIVEFSYISFVSKGFFNPFDGIFYSLIGFFLFLLSILKFLTLLRKEGTLTFNGKLLLFSMIVVVFLTSIIPVYKNSIGLRVIDLGNVNESIYYDFLKKDIYEGADSEMKKLMNTIFSLAAKEQNDLKNVVRKIGSEFSELVNTNAVIDLKMKKGKFIFRIPSYSDFYSLSNRENYSKDLKSLNDTLVDFMFDSNSRYKEIDRSFKKLKKIAKKYYMLSNDTMRKDFRKSIVGFFERKPKITGFMAEKTNEFFDSLENQPVKSMVIYPYRTYYGIRLILLFMLIFSIIVFLRDEIIRRILGLFPLVLDIIWWFKIKSPMIFVEWKIPSIMCKIHSGIVYFIPAVVMVIAVFTVLCGKIFEKGVKG